MRVLKHTAEMICDISEEMSQGELIAFDCLDNRNAIFAVAKKEVDYRTFRSGASFSKIKPDTRQDYSVFITSDEGAIHLTDIVGEEFNIHHIQPLSKNRLLLVCARSRWRSGTDFDCNGRIYGADGVFQKEILLGDGIQDVQVTTHGKIWTSYFDEGVFGNYGWNDPVGSSGLIAWKANGEKVYEYSPMHGLDVICDCYALNVESDNTTWCYYLDEFPLVKIKDGKEVGYWTIPIRGSDAFAIYRNFALFRGGYNDSDHLYLIQLLENNVAKVVKKISLENVSKVDSVSARGDSLLILSGKFVYRVSVHDFL